MSDTSVLQQQENSFEPSALLELFVLDVTPIGGQILYFYSGTSAQYTPISFKGIQYQPLPIQVSGMEQKSAGELPRPTIKMANFEGFATSLILKYDDLLGAILTRRRTYAAYLDGQPEGGPDAPEYPPDVFYIEQKTSENKLQVEFECTSPLDVDGIMLPRRQITANICGVIYRGAECGFAGNYFVADMNGNTRPLGTPLIAYRGTWSSTLTWALGDCATRIVTGVEKVFYALGTIVASQPAPESNSSWKLIQTYRGLYDPTITYITGDVVYTLSMQGFRQVFICDVPGITGSADNPYPISDSRWLADSCSKRLDTGCKPRFDPLPTNKPLPFAAFPGTSLIPQA